MLVDLIFANNILLKMRYGFDIETAEGEQLNIIGKWIGVDRFYPSTNIWNRPYTALVNYSNVQDDEYGDFQGGFSTFSNFEDNNGGFLTYLTYASTRTQVNEIGDEYFKPLIKLKIIKNTINYTMKNIDDAIWQWSDKQIYTTWDTMKVTYHYPESLSTLMELAVYKDLLIAPIGCTIQTEVIS